MGRFKIKKQDTFIDMTPMSDVMVLLLTFFMLTATFVKEAAENTQTSESRIRDTDMASEMVVYSKNNILLQAGQSMLAQANQSNQGVLSLLQ